MAEINADKLEVSLRKRLKEAMRKNIIPGGAVAIYQHGKLVCHVIEGYRNLDTQEPITTETMFRLASMTKPYVPEGTPGLAADQSWGLGVRVLRNHACLPDGCYGWSGAYGTHFWVDPQNDITAVYLKNVRRIGLMTVHHIEIDVMSSLE